MGYIRDRWKDPARKGKGKRWQVKYQVDGREKDGGSFDVKEVAKRKLVELESSVHRGQWVDPTDRTTVAELVRAHAATRMHRPRTASRIDSMVRNHLEATPLGARRVAAVRPSEAQSWITDRSQHLAPQTLRILVTLVRSAFNAAVLDRLVGANPFARVTLPRIEREQSVPLTVAQVAAVTAEIGERYAPMVLVQARCGLRIGEMLAVRVGDVDFLRRTLRVEDQIDRVTRERVPPKTPRSRRTVPMPDVVTAALARHIATYPPLENDLIFRTAAGLPIAHDWYGNKIFVPAALRAGLPSGTTSHALRHHYATDLIDNGVSVIEVAGLLGHEDATQVIKVYGHRVPGSEDRVRKVLDAGWAAGSERSVDGPTAQGRPG